MAKIPSTWIVVADGARARFFTPSDDARKLVSMRSADMVAPASRQKASELKSDKPGRSYSSARSGMRHALEPPHDYQKLEKHRFTAQLADALDAACKQRAYDELVVVAPRRSLGELRTLLSKRVTARLRLEIAKDLTNDTMTAIWKRIRPQVRPLPVATAKPAKPGTARR